MARKFSREILRILLLIPLLVVLGLLFMWQSKPRFEESFTRYANLAIDSAEGFHASSKGSFTVRSSDQTDERNGNNWSNKIGGSEIEGGDGGGFRNGKGATKTLFEFDPNTINLTGLMELGFSQKQAQGILNYRKAGAIFHTPSDFGRCYTVSNEKLQQLIPYINIDLGYMNGSNIGSDRGRSSLKQTPPETQTRVENFDNPTLSLSNINTPSTTATVPFGTSSKSAFETDTNSAERYFAPRLIDLNSADSATLIKVRGIGSLTAQRIIEYRNRMGGIARIEQLQDVQGMNERNYLSIIQQIFIDSSGITKIDINFALPEQLKGHPYLPSRTLNKLLKQRQLKGGWRDTGDLIEQNILSREEAEKLAPYLYFRPTRVRNQ